MSPSSRLPTFLAKPSAKLSLEQDRIFLHPSFGPHEDPFVRGTLTFSHSVKASIEFYTGLDRILSCPKVPLYLTSNPVPPGDLPEPLEEHLQHSSDELGPLAVTFSSPHLTVASLVKTSVTFFAPPLDVTITSIRTHIAPSFTISYADPSQIAQPRTRRYPVIQIFRSASKGTPLEVLSALDQSYPSSTPLALWERGKEWRWERIMRMPDDDIARPTTYKATTTRIRVRNKILAEIRYRKTDGDGRERHLTVGKKVRVASCYCLLERLVLPAYSPSTPKIDSVSSTMRCLCRFTLAEMWERGSLALERVQVGQELSAWISGGEEEEKSAVRGL